MFKIAIQHIISEIALSTLFNRLTDNFRVPEIQPIIDFGDLPSIKEDIAYFVSMRDNSRTDDERRTYNDMINNLVDVMTVASYKAVDESTQDDKYVPFDGLGESYINSVIDTKEKNPSK